MADDRLLTIEQIRVFANLFGAIAQHLPDGTLKVQDGESISFILPDGTVRQISAGWE